MSLYAALSRVSTEARKKATSKKRRRTEKNAKRVLAEQDDISKTNEERIRCEEIRLRCVSRRFLFFESLLFTRKEDERGEKAQYYQVVLENLMRVWTQYYNARCEYASSDGAAIDAVLACSDGTIVVGAYDDDKRYPPRASQRVFTTRRCQSAALLGVHSQPHRWLKLVISVYYSNTTSLIFPRVSSSLRRIPYLMIYARRSCCVSVGLPLSSHPFILLRAQQQHHRF